VPLVRSDDVPDIVGKFLAPVFDEYQLLFAGSTIDSAGGVMSYVKVIVDKTTSVFPALSRERVIILYSVLSAHVGSPVVQTQLLTYTPAAGMLTKS
jgi:hypothetical protein